MDHCCCEGACCEKMDGESGLDDTSPAGDREFRASAVEKWKVGMQTNTHPPSPKHTHTYTHTRFLTSPSPWFSGGEHQNLTGSWWMWAMTERRSQSLSAPEPHCSFTITTIHPPPLTAVLQGLQSEEYGVGCCCPNVWTAYGNTK